MADPIPCIYWGLFIDEGQLLFPPSLARPIEQPHVTFAFRQSCPAELVGSRAEVLADGYGNDGLNEALRVVLPSWLAAPYAGADVPHVTLSVGDGGRPKDSALLLFEDRPATTLGGTIGYFGFDERVHVG